MQLPIGNIHRKIESNVNSPLQSIPHTIFLVIEATSYHSSKPELRDKSLLVCNEETFNWPGDFPAKPSDKQEQKVTRREQVIGLVEGKVYGKKQDFSIKVS